jgi:hypothetical protein
LKKAPQNHFGFSSLNTVCSKSLFYYQPEKYDVNDEISMPGSNAALHELYFFTIRVYTSANSTAADPDPTRVLHQSICVRYAKRSQGTSVGLCCRWCSQRLIKSGRNWFKSKHILLLSTWQNNYIIFNDTFLIILAWKRSGPHTKITKQNLLWSA